MWGVKTNKMQVVVIFKAGRLNRKTKMNTTKCHNETENRTYIKLSRHRQLVSVAIVAFVSYMCSMQTTAKTSI